MNPFFNRFGSVALGVALVSSLAAPALANKLDGNNGPGIGASSTASTAGTTAGIDFGDDSSEWARDGECDDPRFSGTGMAAAPVDIDILKDATDCRAAIEAGTVTFVGDTQTAVAAGDIDYGDDTSQWANDGECDDPRFTGAGVAAELEDVDILKDATDCRAAVAAGTATFVDGQTGTAATGAGTTVGTPVPFDYGSDFSAYANDGECDDPRFYGEGVAKKLLLDDLGGDATDCETLETAAKVTIRTIYTPAYAAAAPYDSSAINFGDNTSDYADDDFCDDPRFEGPGAASTLLDSDRLRDAVDCKAAYEAGTIMLVTDANGR